MIAPSRSVDPIIIETFVNFPCFMSVFGSSVKKAPVEPGGSTTGTKGTGFINGFLAS